ncbi:MAG: four helix bundle protein [Patescibacteria group bacterium]
MQTFKDLKVWQKAHNLVLTIYKVTRKFPTEEKFGLTSQLRRAAISIASNIVEGFKRKTKNDSLHFYTISEGSLEEVKYQTLLAKDLGYFPKQTYEEITANAEEIGRMLCGFKKAISQPKILV